MATNINRRITLIIEESEEIKIQSIRQMKR